MGGPGLSVAHTNNTSLMSTLGALQAFRDLATSNGSSVIRGTTGIGLARARTVGWGRFRTVPRWPVALVGFALGSLLAMVSKLEPETPAHYGGYGAILGALES
eukprot:9493427-Pyramimonas_sp.AAC.1